MRRAQRRLEKRPGLVHIFCKKTAAVVSKRLESGRDRLLELHSFRPAIGNRIVESIAKSEKDKTLEQFMIDFFKILRRVFGAIGKQNL